jgi:hypothetical protein
VKGRKSGGGSSSGGAAGAADGGSTPFFTPMPRGSRGPGEEGN